MAGHQIRASYDKDTITVYQAYSAEIALAAVSAQKLSASPAFKPGRMTWIKPSWCWMMYRAAYSYKDPRQSHILAIKMTHANFFTLLRHAQLAHKGSSRVTGAQVMVQWDPERGPRLERYDYRSIQIGISGTLVGRWIDEWILGIEDVTDVAKEMKRVIDEDGTIGIEQLQSRELMPVERILEVPDDIARILDIVRTGEQKDMRDTSDE